ncbi:bifunctional metallophosphatase/5'-nucleotidase [Mesohalobacter halotolerans]|uniref:Bifunctional metallophosphatase/5'-nucleotidase n=1 Tax=Mesohalobacter halotolerans TaxID=1883405 RepID=A0A4U5TRW4_9FLAO|nr:metallophosphatase [Mesohalobacter halotolerans]TKS56144.1 bifunctional metallophosphatase/5'-nucleotidase [Mesohalobacter halotolerans]
MNRRTFINQTIKVSSLVGLSSVVHPMIWEKSYDKHITILHTNDVHSHIDPFPQNHRKFPNRGGVSRRYSLIQQIKAKNPNTLLLDAGDAFQGTPYFNFYGGELEYKLMSKMGYQASTIGNHEFDNGIDNIAAQLQHAKFDLLNANYDLSNTSLDGLVRPYQIYEVEGISIGVFGLGIELDGLVSKKLYKETQYLNPVEVAQDQVKILKQDHQCDLVICLSHLGYDYQSDKISDIKLAEQTQDIDLIIGGHTHTFLDKPSKVLNQAGKITLINQVGWAGLNLGRIDFYFSHNQEQGVKDVVIEV